MKTIQARSVSGKRYTGIHWKIWPTKDGESRRLYITYRAGGKQRWEAVPQNTVTAAKALRAAHLAKVAAGDYLDPDKGKTMVSELAEKWFRALQCKPQSQERYRSILDLHILPALGDRELRSLTIEDVEVFARQLQGGLAVGSCKLVVGQLKRVLKAGVRWQYLKSNPADYASITYAREAKVERSPLTRKEARRFLDYLKAASPDWYPFFLMAISTGMRMGEMSAAKWENMDCEAGTYYVRETVTRKRTFDLTKTEASQARVALSPGVLAALAEQKTVVAKRILSAREWPYPGLIFPNSRGKPFDHQSLDGKVFKPLLLAAGIRAIRFHDLRHTCASLLIANGAPVKAVQRQMRHASAQMTLDTYGHLYPEDHAAAAEQLDRVLCG